LDDCVVGRCAIASDQERKLTKNISLILEAGNHFSRRRMIAGIDWGGARVKPGHYSPLSMTPLNGLNWMVIAFFPSFPESRISNACIKLALRHLFSALVVDYQLIHQEHAHPAIVVAAYHMG